MPSKFSERPEECLQEEVGKALLRMRAEPGKGVGVDNEIN
jgi:hypothetical protein